VSAQRFKHGRLKQHELWSPNLIGWHYHPARQRSMRHARQPSAPLATGHVRNQPHGPGRTQRKLIWIEPMLVGVNGEPDAIALSTVQAGGSTNPNRSCGPRSK